MFNFKQINMKRNKILFTIFIACGLFMGCKKALDVSPLGQFAPNNVLTTDAGIKAVLFSAYTGMQNGTASRFVINTNEVTTDIGFNSGGAENLQLTQLIKFTWDASLGTLQSEDWVPQYNTIRDANVVLDNIEDVNTTDDNKKLYTAEARFLRAYAYDFLYKMFGPVPLRTTSVTPPALARTTDDSIRTFIETELLASIPDLPDPGKELAYGRVTKGAAWGILAKYYLQTKQWKKAADACQKVTDFNYYQLFPRYQDMFRVENKGNKEMILVIPCLNLVGYGNWFSAGALPPAFKRSPQIPDFTWTPSMANFATQYRMRSAFTNTFDTINDTRAILLIRHYYNNSGAYVNLLATADNVRSLKYWDNGTVANQSANDIPLLRYADILLSRAEALNELNGPTQEALDLINQVRKRAGIADLTMADATDQATLRSLILRERGWEFYTEGKRREDLLRNGTFISNAQARGITVATDKQKLFPIPQTEIDANPLCVQNPGY
jgi:starch-binding outer membrane protein, SusD/RagB family